MTLSIISLIVTLGLTYIWLTRGFFSALIHLVCTIIAGAIAFAAWEPLSYLILDSSPTGGTMSFASGVAWAVGLIAPFVVSLILLRLGIDALLPSNVVLDPKLDYVGGGVCGLAIGILTAGILSISLGFLRMDTDFPNQPIEYGTAGSLKRAGGMTFPADKIVAKLYGSLSEHGFRASDPLARWHPDVQEEGGALRINFGPGRARNTLRSNEFEVKGRFTVGMGGNGNVADFLKDRWDSTPQKCYDLDGNEITKGYIEGFVVDFKPAAKEMDGKVVVGAAQVHLIVENDNDERQTVFPIAVSSQADAAKPTPARWRFNTADTYIASVGGAADAYFAFEFICPPGFHPIALYVKGVRYEVDPSAKPTYQFTSAAERDAAIGTGGLLAAAPGKSGATTAGGGGIDYSEAVKITRAAAQGGGGQQPPEGMRITEMLPFVIQKGVHGNLVLDEENNKNIILNGDAVLELTVLQNRGLEKPIQIQRLLTTPDTIVVQIDVGGTSKMSLVGKSDLTGAPSLYDSNGTAYSPVGYIYQDETKVKVSFKPGEPITAMNQLDALSRSRPAQKMTLIFRCSKGVSLKGFGVGEKAMVTFDPPVLLDQTQGRF
jgi:hypothetical protein